MNIIETVIEYLTAEIENIPVYAEEPQTPESTYIICEKTGSGRNNLINQSTIAVQSYGATLYEASVLNEQVKNAMAEFITEDGISNVSVSSDYNWTDEETRRYRYQSVYEITHI